MGTADAKILYAEQESMLNSSAGMEECGWMGRCDGR